MSTGSSGGSWKIDAAALFVACLALAVAGYAAYQSQRQANEGKRQADIALESFNSSLKASEKLLADKELFDWQVTTIASIIDKHSSVTEFGLSFEEIKKEFLAKVAQRQTEVPKKAIQDDELDRVIIHLKSTSQIFRLHDGKYMTNMLEPQYGFGRTLVMNEAGEEMIAFLATHGPADAQTIRNAIEKYQLTNREFFFTLSNYAKEGLITVNKDKKFESVLDASQFDKQ